ncbi:DUF1294-domain-containing protein [Setomelanomma holmii]|uniref:DUF1294-domain-containing protein n=1 Tax=Setomelanomma holmii TaxID=210430 RepID=A0A9P4LHH7_9PLEO|nr:DUF1294-domain-containing protein [Setomelanomma holmii]
MPPKRNRARPHNRPLTPATLAGLASLILPSFTLVRLYTTTHSLLPLAWTCLASSITFLFYGYDKMPARNLEWRVSEATLHVLALVGGWPGALVGMHYFQHKTRKRGFLVVFWGITLGWEGVCWGWLKGGT